MLVSQIYVSSSIIFIYGVVYLLAMILYFDYGEVICVFHLNHQHKNIERQKAHTIVSWPNHKQWKMGHTSDLMMILRWSTLSLTIIIRKMGKPNTQSSIYYMKDNWIIWRNLTHTRQNVPNKYFRNPIPLIISMTKRQTAVCKSTIPQAWATPNMMCMKP